MLGVTDLTATIGDAEKLQDWINDAAHHWWERALEGLLRIGFFASIVIALTIEYYQTTPELIRGGHALGEVFRNLAYGYAAAYIFHVLVVTLPARARARRAYRAIGLKLERIVKLLKYARLEVESRGVILRSPTSFRQWLPVHEAYVARVEDHAKDLVVLGVDLPLDSARIIAQLAEPGPRRTPDKLATLIEQCAYMNELGDKLLSDWARTWKTDPRRPTNETIFRCAEMNSLLAELGA